MFNSNLLVDIPVNQDIRGDLFVIQNNKQLPFHINRVFWIKNITKGQTRGNHAHKTCWELVIAISGKFSIELKDKKNNKQNFILSSSNMGLLIPPMIWCKLYDFSENAICLCLASETYTPEGYINSYNELINNNL